MDDLSIFSFATPTEVGMLRRKQEDHGQRLMKTELTMFHRNVQEQERQIRLSKASNVLESEETKNTSE